MLEPLFQSSVKEQVHLEFGKAPILQYHFFHCNGLMIYLSFFEHKLTNCLSKEKCQSRVGFILEHGFAGFPHLEKMLHKIYMYLGESNGVHKTGPRISSNFLK